MSDSFADLWNSTAPTKPTQPQTLGSASNSFGTAARSTLSSTPLGAGRGSTSGTGRKPYQSQDVFTLLSAASASGLGSARSSPVSYSSGYVGASAESGPSSRSITPVINTNTSAVGTTSQSRSAISASTNKDAFSSLFSDSLGGNLAEQREDLRTMTMAERAEKHRLDSLKKHAPNLTVGSENDSNWAALDVLARPSNISKNSRSASPAVGNAGSSVLDEFSFEPIRPSKLDSTASAYTTSTKPPEHDLDDDWGLGDFGKPSSRTKNATSSTPSLISQQLPGRPSKQQQQSKSLWDLGGFDASASASPVQSHDSALSFETQPDSSSKLPDDKRRRTDTRRPDSPSDDFDFGNREDPLLAGMDSDDEEGFGHEHAGHGGDGDDILGMLSQPVDLIRQQREKDQRRDKQRQRQAGEFGRSSALASSGGPLSANGRALTPPPHILGKLVEMGFSIEQAKTALASTETGLDVEVALELLLAGVTEDAIPQAPKSRQREDSMRSSAPDLGPRERTRERDRTRQRDREQDANLAIAPNIQEQADKLLAQASEIGMSVLSKASLFWKEGKEKVQKVYEERTGASLSGAGASGSGGKRDRPKWMQDEVDDEEGGAASPQSAFRDDDHPNDKTRHGLQNKDQELRPGPEKAVNILDGDRRSAKENRTDAPQRTEPNLFGLDGDTMPQIYRSPFRRGNPDSGSSSPALRQPTPTQPSPPRKLAPVRPLVQAPVASLTASTRHKAQGGAKFKIGQYGDAEVSYTKAIECLPEGHLLLVPLLNNRALVRLKNGEYKGAAEDATRAVEIITKVFGVNQAVDLGGIVVGSNGQVADGDTSNGLNGNESNIDIGDGYVKAIRRRAEALEGREKWTEASKDWEVIVDLDWVKGNVKDVALRGIGRCRQMVNGASSVGGSSHGLNSSNVPSSPQPKRAPPPKPKPRPIPVASSTAESKALKALRSQTQAAESEDLQRHALKDSVDAKLSTWKSGKETNIRALLASLDLVLWSELGVQKVGMHELVSPAQVKSRYVRVIARLHPDKLNAGNTTVEQRMIANAVFGALNEAWNAFKQ